MIPEDRPERRFAAQTAQERREAAGGVREYLRGLWTAERLWESAGRWFRRRPHPDCPQCVAGDHSGLMGRFRAWRDGTAWHHVWVANGRLWWTCRDCRALRRSDEALAKIEREI